MTKLSRLSRVSALVALSVVAAATLVACGKKSKEVTQSAARVDGTEITVLQIKYRMSHMRVRPDQVEAASHRVLDQLIDEQLIVDKADKEKLDKQADTAQAIDAARREVLAKAYMEQVAFAVPAPTDEMLHRYYADNPAMFENRRVFTLHEFLAKVPAAQQPALKAMVDGGKTQGEVAAWLKSQNDPFREQEGEHPSTQVASQLKVLSSMADGHGIIETSGDTVHIVYLVSSQQQPLGYEQAKAGIAQFLTAEARRKASEGNLAALRSAAKITYAAPYESLAASQPAITTHDIAASAPEAIASGGAHVVLPEVQSSGVKVTLPDATTSTEHVTLPAANTTSVHVSLPTAESSVHVSLPPQTTPESGKK